MATRTDARAGFERLIATDPTVAVLARLQAIALRAADDPAWAQGVPSLAQLDHPADPRGLPLDQSSAISRQLSGDPAYPCGLPLSLGRERGAGGEGLPRQAGGEGLALPLLNGATLLVDAERLTGLLRALAASLGLADRLAARDADPLELLRASVAQDGIELEAVAARLGLGAPLVAVVGYAASLPLLIAGGRRAAEAVRATSWPHGYCPVCAAWPTLMEVRGLARDLFLRCGRCGSAWPSQHRRCVFCGNHEEGTQRYFAAEHEREMRKATTCDRCHGYLKSQTTLAPLDVAGILLCDLESVDLDVVALEHGYGRPDGLGRPLSVRIEPTPRTRHGWRRWW